MSGTGELKELLTGILDIHGNAEVDLSFIGTDNSVFMLKFTLTSPDDYIIYQLARSMRDSGGILGEICEDKRVFSVKRSSVCDIGNLRWIDNQYTFRLSGETSKAGNVLNQLINTVKEDFGYLLE